MGRKGLGIQFVKLQPNGVGISSSERKRFGTQGNLRLSVSSVSAVAGVARSWQEQTSMIGENCHIFVSLYMMCDQAINLSVSQHHPASKPKSLTPILRKTKAPKGSCWLQ